MTDTTDTKALREEVERLREELLVERNAAINLSHYLSDCAGKLRAANAELAALKGEQVPVAYTDKLSLETLQGNGMACMWKQGHGAEWREQIELFTAPQKPVVLPELPQLFKEAIAWGRVYGPTMGKDLWFEMLETQASNFATRAAGGRCGMKTLKEAREAMLELVHDHTEGDADKALKLFSVLLVAYMLESKKQSFKIQRGGVLLEVSLTLKNVH